MPTLLYIGGLVYIYCCHTHYVSFSPPSPLSFPLSISHVPFFTNTHTMACFVKGHFFTWNNSFLRILFLLLVLFTFPPPHHEKEIVIFTILVFLHTCFVRKKKWDILYTWSYIYILYTCYYTHTFYHNRVWYHGIDLHENDDVHFGVCVYVHIYFLYGKISPQLCGKAF